MSRAPGAMAAFRAPVRCRPVGLARAGGAAAHGEAVGFDFTTISRFIDDQKQEAAAPLALPRAQEDRRDALNEVAHLFRRVAAKDPVMLMPTFAFHDTGAIGDLLASPAFVRMPAIWSYFFYGSLVHIGGSAHPSHASVSTIRMWTAGS